MNKKRIAIYDLDNTLIDTEKLKELRSKRDWKNIYDNFHLSYLNPKVRNYIDKLNKEIFIDFIIVTSSPKIYAQKLLNFHNFLNTSKIIGYHDTKLKKPNPEPYLKAIENIGSFDEIYIFGDQESDFIAAERLKKILKQKIFKVGCSWYFKCKYSYLDREITLEEI
ncbi:HAD-IA family hydrolase [Cetobacterium somerae]